MDIKKIAFLARLKISKEEEKTLQKEISKFFKYVEKISSIDTRDVQPLFSPSDGKTLFRSDEVKAPSSSSDFAFKNAPDHVDGFFKTPPTIRSSSFSVKVSAPK